MRRRKKNSHQRNFQKTHLLGGSVEKMVMMMITPPPPPFIIIIIIIIIIGMRVFIVNPSLGTEWNSQTALTLLPTWPSWGLACCCPWDQCKHHHPHHSCLPVATGTANSTLLPSPTWLWIPPFLPCPSGRNNLAMLCSLPHPELSVRMGKIPGDSMVCRAQPRWQMQEETWKRETICSAEHQKQIFLRRSYWFRTFSRS